MLRSTFSQLSFTDINPDTIGLAYGAFERLLHERVEDLVSLEDFEGFYHADGGVESCCPLVLFAMLMLQFRYNASDGETKRCSRRDLGWKYAMCLGADEQPPSMSSFKRYRKKVRKLLGEEFVHERVLQLAQRERLIDDTELQAVDSTNTDCRGAILDTFNLIARAFALVLRRVSEWTGEPLEELAERLWASESHSPRIHELL